MNEDFTCQHCGLIQGIGDGGPFTKAILTDVPLPNGKKHIKVSCAGCGKYIKFMSQGGPIVFYFGKHKGKAIEEVEKQDKEYLIWLLANNIGGNKIARAIRTILDKNL